MSDNLRPNSFSDLVGQEDAKIRLQIAISAAKQRNEPVPHILLGGSSPGIGKTTIAYIVANEYGVKSTYVNSPGVKKIGELIPILTNLEPNSILIFDEIHALSKAIAENLLPAMEEQKLTIKLLNREVATIPLHPFTIIGCTTEFGKLIAPFRDRFEIQFNLQPYSDSEIALIVSASIKNLKLNFSGNVIDNIAKRARGVPRIANRFVKRVRDFADIKNNGVVTEDIVNQTMSLERIDEQGLSDIDKKYLFTLYSRYASGPCGLETMASTIGEDTVTVKEFIEPFLIRKGYISIGKQGRSLSESGIKFAINISRQGGM